MHWQSLKREVQIIIIKINDSVTIFAQLKIMLHLRLHADN